MCEERNRIVLCKDCNNRIIVHRVTLECRLHPTSYTDYTDGTIVNYHRSCFTVNRDGKCKDFIDLVEEK